MNEMKIREVIESGFKVTITEENSFRFCENPVYKNLSSLSLKEMDIGWWDITDSKLFLLELKGCDIWREFDKSEDSAHKYLLKSLKGKITDTLLMLAAVWVETGKGKELKIFLPNHIHQYPSDGNLIFIVLIDTPISRKPLLLSVKDAINRELAGRIRLFNVKYVTLVDFDTARTMGLPVQRK